MNRRSFIAGILAACAAPTVLLPGLKDHARWRVARNRHGFYVAEFKYAVRPMTDKELEEVVFFDASEPTSHFEPNPDWITASHGIGLPALDPAREYAGKWQFLEWKGPPSYVPSQT